MVGEMLQQRRGGSRVKSGVSIDKEAIFISNVNQMAKFMASGNVKHLTGVVSNKHF